MLRILGAVLAISAATAAVAQVHYYEDGRPWRQRARGGPDQVVPGWYYNLGVTGLRVELVADAPEHLVVRHVFAGSPAEGKVEVGDHIVGAGGKRFVEPHRNGYGMKVFGPDGPILDFARALDESLGSEGDQRGRLAVSLLRAGDRLEVDLQLPAEHGTYAETFPADCDKTDALLGALLGWLLDQQRDDGSFGSPPDNLFAPLAMLSSGDAKY